MFARRSTLSFTPLCMLLIACQADPRGLPGVPPTNGSAATMGEQAGYPMNGGDAWDATARLRVALDRLADVVRENGSNSNPALQANIGDLDAMVARLQSTLWDRGRFQQSRYAFKSVERGIGIVDARMLDIDPGSPIREAWTRVLDALQVVRAAIE